MKYAEDRDIMYKHSTAELVSVIAQYPGAKEIDWYKWYLQRWLGSSRRHKLSLVAQGAFRNLLDRAWEQPDCGLPVDIDELQFMAEATAEEWSKISHDVVSMFERIGDRLYSKRLLCCRYEAVIKSGKASKNAGARWSKDSKNDKKHANAMRLHANALQSNALSLSLSLSDQEKSLRETKSRQTTDSPYTTEFEEFWKRYPRKTAKGAAWRSWIRLRAPAETLARITDALTWQTQTEQWRKDSGAYIPHPATYLNQRRWEDVPPAKQSSGPAYHRPFPATAMGQA